MNKIERQNFDNQIIIMEALRNEVRDRGKFSFENCKDKLNWEISKTQELINPIKKRKDDCCEMFTREEDALGEKKKVEETRE